MPANRGDFVATQRTVIVGRTTVGEIADRAVRELQISFRAYAYTNNRWVCPNNSQGIYSSNVNTNLGTDILPNTNDWSCIGIPFVKGSVIHRIHIKARANSADITTRQFKAICKYGPMDGTWNSNAETTREDIVPLVNMQNAGNNFFEEIYTPEYTFPEDADLLPIYQLTNTGTTTRYLGQNWIIKYSVPYYQT